MPGIAFLRSFARSPQPTTGRAQRNRAKAFIERLLEKYGRRSPETNDGSAPILVDQHIRILGPVVAFLRDVW